MTPAVLFVGPCRKHDPRSGRPHADFSEATPTGRYAHEVAGRVVKSGQACRIVLTNVLPRASFAADGRTETAPQLADLLEGWPEFEGRLATISPFLIVGFGATVRAAFAAADRVPYVEGPTMPRAGGGILFARHPSFVLRYRRREMTKSISDLERRIRAHLDRGAVTASAPAAYA